MGLPESHGSACQQRNDGYRDRSCLPAIARDPLRGAIAKAIRPRQHRPGSQVPLDVCGKGADGGVALDWILLQGLGENGIEIALQRTLVLRICHCFAGGPTDHAADLGGERGAATRGQFVGTCPRQDFVTDNTQAVHIAGGSNGLAANLFGTRIVGRKGPAPL